MEAVMIRTLGFAVIIAVFLCGINPALAKTVTILALGDSLTAGLGLPVKDAFPAQLEARLKAKGHEVKVINSGVSGETSSGTKARLEWTLAQNPDCVILETGANDMLRAVDPDVTRANIETILKVLKDRKIPVLLAGMRAFANLGPEYTQRYESVFPDLAKKYGALYYPFFLRDVAMHPDLLQDDGMHPNAAGVGRIVDGVMPNVEKLLAEKP
jgi:acyl-CoA thioesterase-1